MDERNTRSEKGKTEMNYDELEIIEIGEAEDVVLANGSSWQYDNEITMTRRS